MRQTEPMLVVGLRDLQHATVLPEDPLAKIAATIVSLSTSRGSGSRSIVRLCIIVPTGLRREASSRSAGSALAAGLGRELSSRDQRAIEMAEENVGENGHPGRPSDGGRGDSGRRRPCKQSRRGSRGPRPSAGGSRPGAIGLRRIGGEDFELVHPRAVRETELDYEEGIELWKAGDPESARDALRYALSACHDNIWVHVALGQIALAEFRDPGACSRALWLRVRPG